MEGFENESINLGEGLHISTNEIVSFFSGKISALLHEKDEEIERLGELIKKLESSNEASRKKANQLTEKLVSFEKTLLEPQSLGIKNIKTDIRTNFNFRVIRDKEERKFVEREYIEYLKTILKYVFGFEEYHDKEVRYSKSKWGTENPYNNLLWSFYDNQVKVLKIINNLDNELRLEPLVISTDYDKETLRRLLSKFGLIARGDFARRPLDEVINIKVFLPNLCRNKHFNNDAFFEEVCHLLIPNLGNVHVRNFVKYLITTSTLSLDKQKVLIELFINNKMVMVSDYDFTFLKYLHGLGGYDEFVFEHVTTNKYSSNRFNLIISSDKLADYYAFIKKNNNATSLLELIDICLNDNELKGIIGGLILNESNE